MTIRNLFSIFLLAFALSAVAMPISANACGKHHKKYAMTHCPKMKRCYNGLVRGECQMIPGHWWMTVWVPAKKACWYIAS